MRLIILSGRSGSGKSSALNLLEDTGFNCIDNLPVALLPELVQQSMNSPYGEHQKTAVCIDARNVGDGLDHFPELLEALPDEVHCEIIFLDAKNDTLIRRFSETRRRHPLSSKDRALQEAIAKESELLAPIAAAASLNIDTSQLNLHQLRDMIRQRVVPDSVTGMSILFQSFGFKHGVPVDSDMVFDIRCLPNPYWHIELRPLTGLDDEVATFLQAQEEVADMFADICNYLQNWLPKFTANNRSYLTISIGCTGGQHRSVYLVESLYKHFLAEGGTIQRRHRELLALQNH